MLSCQPYFLNLSIFSPFWPCFCQIFRFFSIFRKILLPRRYAPTGKLGHSAIKVQTAHPDGVICHLGSKVSQASLSREGDRVSGGRSFSWHRFIKFYTARVLLQSHIRSTASRCGSVTLRLWQSTGLSFTTVAPLRYLAEGAFHWIRPFNYRSIKTPLSEARSAVSSR